MPDDISSTEMHRWTDREGKKWECNAYDHGPFCRLCHCVDWNNTSPVTQRDEANDQSAM